MFTDVRATRTSIPTLDSKASRALREAAYDEALAILVGLPTDYGHNREYKEGHARYEAMREFGIACHTACMYAIQHGL